jgi:hypothetical protein
MNRLLMILAAVLTIGACGAGSGGGGNAIRVGDVFKVTDQANDALADIADAAAAQREADKCRRQIGSLLGTLNEIDSRLDIGLSQTEYADFVGDASVVYDAIPFRRLTADCIDAAVHLENAFNHYITANSDWDDCIWDFDCDVERDVLSGMRIEWDDASRQLDKVERKLTRMASGSGPVV